MTQSAVVFTEEQNGRDAGRELANKIVDKLGDKIPSVVIVFASSVYDYPSLLESLNEVCRPELIVGSSSAGEFTSKDLATDSACAVAIYSDEMKFSAGFAEGIKKDRKAVVEKLNSILSHETDYQHQYYSAMVFADALSGHTDEIVELLTEKTMGKYQFFGGGAGDNASFQRTHVFYGTEAFTDAAVIMEVLSNKPIGVGAAHGWKPAGTKMRVTQADGMKLISLNARPAVELFVEHAASTGQTFDLEQPLPFFLHNILGIEVAGDFKLRVPLAILEDGSLTMASNIPEGAYVHFMVTDNDCSEKAATTAAVNALKQIGDYKPSVALFFDCVATRLRMGKEFNLELGQISKTLEGTDYAGCNTYGQIARVDGQFSGFQNCTAVVCVIPE